MNTENILFELTFDTRFWDRAPGVTVHVDGVTHFQDLLPMDQYQVRFRQQLEFGKTHTLCIDRWNKTDDQCQNFDSVLNDQITVLRQVCIDGVDLANVVHTRSYYYPQYSRAYSANRELENEVLGETWFGHNGQWVLEFRSPVWQWLIEDIWNG